MIDDLDFAPTRVLPPGVAFLEAAPWHQQHPKVG
jgi:hypothetical protein